MLLLVRPTEFRGSSCGLPGTVHKSPECINICRMQNFSLNKGQTVLIVANPLDSDGQTGSLSSNVAWAINDNTVGTFVDGPVANSILFTAAKGNSVATITASAQNGVNVTISTAFTVTVNQEPATGFAFTFTLQ